MRQGPFVNDAEEFVRNISVLLEEKSPHDYSVRRIEEILLNNGYLEEYFKGNTEPHWRCIVLSILSTMNPFVMSAIIKM